jgi:hypothetical protein
MYVVVSYVLHSARIYRTVVKPHLLFYHDIPISRQHIQLGFNGLAFRRPGQSMYTARSLKQTAWSLRQLLVKNSRPSLFHDPVKCEDNIPTGHKVFVRWRDGKRQPWSLQKLNSCRNDTGLVLEDRCTSLNHTPGVAQSDALLHVAWSTCSKVLSQVGREISCG